MYPAKAADVRRVARSLSDDVNALVEELDGARHAMFVGEKRGARHDLPILIRAVQHKLAMIYGERHGWRLSASRFAPAVLAGRDVSARAGDPADGWSRAAADHPFFYRAERRAAAVVAHLYRAADQDRAGVGNWAAAHRLRVAFPTDFPSWWVPGATTLCVYEPLEQTTGVRHD